MRGPKFFEKQHTSNIWDHNPKTFINTILTEHNACPLYKDDWLATTITVCAKILENVLGKKKNNKKIIIKNT